MSRHPVPRRAAPTALAALALVAFGPTSASAAQPSISHVRGTDSHIEQEIGSCLDLPFPLHHETTFNAHFTEQVRNGAFYARVSVTTRNTYTNLDTGASLRALSSFSEVDQNVVDNGDGTLTIRYTASVHEAYHSPRGKVVAKRVTIQTFEVVVDHGGTPADPTDDELVSQSMSEPRGVDTAGPRSDCDIAAEFLS